MKETWERNHLTIKVVHPFPKFCPEKGQTSWKKIKIGAKWVLRPARERAHRKNGRKEQGWIKKMTHDTVTKQFFFVSLDFLWCGFSSPFHNGRMAALRRFFKNKWRPARIFKKISRISQLYLYSRNIFLKMRAGLYLF